MLGGFSSTQSHRPGAVRSDPIRPGRPNQPGRPPPHSAFTSPSFRYLPGPARTAARRHNQGGGHGGPASRSARPQPRWSSSGGQPSPQLILTPTSDSAWDTSRPSPSRTIDSAPCGVERTCSAVTRRISRGSNATPAQVGGGLLGLIQHWLVGAIKRSPQRGTGHRFRPGVTFRLGSDARGGRRKVSARANAGGWQPLWQPRR